MHDPCIYTSSNSCITCTIKYKLVWWCWKWLIDERMGLQVSALKQLQKQELIDFFDEYIKVGAARKKSLSIRVYGSQHLKEMASDKDEVPSPSVEIEDIVGFRKSQPLHGSFRGCGQPELWGLNETHFFIIQRQNCFSFVLFLVVITIFRWTLNC